VRGQERRKIGGEMREKNGGGGGLGVRGACYSTLWGMDSA
jgi:hypothetical protein